MFAVVVFPHNVIGVPSWPHVVRCTSKMSKWLLHRFVSSRQLIIKAPIFLDQRDERESQSKLYKLVVLERGRHSPACEKFPQDRTDPL